MTRRGFSFLEAVMAAALLGIIAASIFGAMGYAMSEDRYDEARLGAAEVANRLIISYLDDSTSVRKLPDTIDYGHFTYRYDFDVETVRIEEPNRNLRDSNGQPGAVPAALVRLKEVSATVWLDEGRPETMAPGSSPGVRINRLVNPIGYRGSDSTERLMGDGERIGELMKLLTGFEDAGGSGQ